MAGAPISDIAETFDTGFGVFTEASPNHPAPTVADGALQFPIEYISFNDQTGFHHRNAQYVATAGTYDLTGGELTVHVGIPRGQGLLWSSEVGLLLTDVPLSTDRIDRAIYLTWTKTDFMGEKVFRTNVMMYGAAQSVTDIALTESEWSDGAWLRVRENDGVLTFDMTDPSCSQQIALGTAPVPTDLDITSLYVSAVVTTSGPSSEAAGSILAVNTNRAWCPDPLVVSFTPESPVVGEQVFFTVSGQKPAGAVSVQAFFNPDGSPVAANIPDAGTFAPITFPTPGPKTASFAWTDDPPVEMHPPGITTVDFTVTEPAPPSPGPGYIWNGTSWVAPSVWNGTRWVPGHEARLWNGTDWVPLGVPPAPVASFTAVHQNAQVGVAAGDPILPNVTYTSFRGVFTATTSDEANSYLWDFGNPQISVVESGDIDSPGPIVVLFRYDIERTVKLTVTGPGGTDTAELGPIGTTDSAPFSPLEG